jgi:hypothetical protein
MSGMACDGERGCTAPLHYADSKGYAYCQKHGDRLKAAGRTGVRAIRQKDIAVRQAEERGKSPDAIAVGRGFQTLTMVEFGDADHDAAERMAKRLGFTQTAYTTTSALWGLFCLPDRATQRRGCIVKTRELGLLYVQDAEDLLMKGS